MPTIRLEKVSKRFADIRAADKLDLTIENGEYLCLLGPTGAGKTTTLRVIAGLTRPDTGKVFFDDRDVTRLEPEKRRAVLLSQTYSLFPTMTVAGNILFGPEIRGVPEDEKRRLLSSLLDLVRLTKRAEAYPRELSGGMMQRTALARALASEPDVLLLDEPLRALDARLRISLRRELRSLSKSLGMTTVHVTHDQDEALVMADRIAVIRNGRIVQIGTPKDIFDEPASPFVANFVGQSNFVPGVVSGRNHHTEVRDDRGRIVQARESSLEEGSRVVVAVKVGNTQLVRDGAYLRGTVERALFEGRSVHVDVHVMGLGRISAKVPPGTSGVAKGDEVGIWWSPDKASVFPYPERGLEEELRVD